MIDKLNQQQGHAFDIAVGAAAAAAPALMVFLENSLALYVGIMGAIFITYKVLKARRDYHNGGE